MVVILLEVNAGLSWGVICLLSTGNLWFIFVMMTGIYPFYITIVFAVWVGIKIKRALESSDLAQQDDAADPVRSLW